MEEPASPTGTDTSGLQLSDRPRLKRPRDTAPTTPRNEEGEEIKVVITPLAKKNRLQPGEEALNAEALSDSDSLELDDPLDDQPVPLPSDSPKDTTFSDPPRPTTPSDFPATSSSTAARPFVESARTPSPPPPPPAHTDASPSTILTGIVGIPPTSPLVSVREGRETQKIRQGVAALEWEDEAERSVRERDANRMTDATMSTVESGSSSGRQSAKLPETRVEEETTETEVKGGDVEMSRKLTESSEKGGMVEDAVVLDEQPSSIQVDEKSVAKVHEEKVEVKDAEVDKTAVETASVAAEVAESTAVITSAVEKESEHVVKPVVQNSFASFSSSASPFAAVSSPALSKPVIAEGSKPKPTSFAVPFVPPTTPTAVISSTSALPSLAISSDSAISLSSLKSPTSTSPTTLVSAPPATPKSKPTIPSSFGASPFSAFASTSGFATPSATGFGTTNGFGSKPVAAFASTPVASTSSTTSGSAFGFGSYSKASSSATAFATIQKDSVTSPSGSGDGDEDGAEDGNKRERSASRKLGEPVEVHASRRIFTEQEVVTGEEDEDTLHSVRGKLYAMGSEGWAERGTGVIKLNAMKRTGGDKTGVRLVMRADATHRLLLNATLFPAFVINLSQDKFVSFVIFEGSDPISYMVRLSNGPAAKGFVDAVTEQVALLGQE